MLQESSGVSWDPAQDCYPSRADTWEVVLAVPLFLILWLVYWRGLRTIASRYAHAHLWVPVVMLALVGAGGLVIGAFGGYFVKEAVGTVLGFINLPVIIPIVLVVIALPPETPGWVAASLGLVGFAAG